MATSLAARSAGSAASPSNVSSATPRCSRQPACTRLQPSAASSSSNSSSRWAPAHQFSTQSGRPTQALGTRRRRQQLARSDYVSRAADLTRGLAAAEDDDRPSSSAAGSAAEGWSLSLISPYDSEIFALAVPALFSVLLDPIMGLVDTAIVGRLGTAPLAAVGVSTIMVNFSHFLWNFLLYTTTPRIAASAAKEDLGAVSKITAQGLWVAGFIGTCTTILLWTCCPRIFAAMGVAENVMAPAVAYLRGRCIASPAVLAFFVLAGTFRGFKDTRTPLVAGVISNVFHLGMDLALVFAFNMGVTGAALATSLSHWLTLAILLRMVMQRGYLRSHDLRQRPTWAEVAPTMRNGLLLSSRSLLSMSLLMWATKLVAGFGAVGLAAHEILRQIWVFSNQLFTALDIATQSLFAYYIGRGDRRTAAAVFRRTLSLAGVAGVAVCGLLLAQQTAFPAIFTKDAAVVAAATTALPLIAAFLPLDATASVMDGVLLASQKAAWMSMIMIVTSAVGATGLIVCQRFSLPLLAVWAVIKCLTLGRLLGNSYFLAVHPASPLKSYSQTA